MKKVYISSSLRPEVYDRVTYVLKELTPKDVFIFRPEKGQLEDKEYYAKIDAKAIFNCDEVWLIGEYGRDCSWEIGYAAGLGKKIVIWKDETNNKLLEDDWMVHAYHNIEVITITITYPYIPGVV